MILLCLHLLSKYRLLFSIPFLYHLFASFCQTGYLKQNAIRGSVTGVAPPEDPDMGHIRCRRDASKGKSTALGALAGQKCSDATLTQHFDFRLAAAIAANVRTTSFATGFNDYNPLSGFSLEIIESGMERK